MAAGEYQKQWHKHLPLANLNYSACYHTSLGCEPTNVIHGRIPYNNKDDKLGLKIDPKLKVTIDFADELPKQTRILYDETKKNVMQTFVKYKNCYDKKSKSFALQERDYSYFLQPKADNQGTKIPFPDFRRIGPFVI